MGTVTLVDAKVYMGEFDVSGDLNQVKLAYSADSLENSAFGSLAHTKQPGAFNVMLHHEGYVQFGSTTTTIDGRLDAKLAVEGVPVSVAAEGGDAGEKGFFFKSLHHTLIRGGNFGELMKFQVDANANGADTQLVKGIIFEDGKTSRTIAGNTATRTLGAVSATQKLYAVLHLKAFVGTNVTFTLKSAVTDFATVTTRATFTANTAVGSQWIVPIPGPITDTFYRFEWTGTFTSFSAVLIAGIQ